MFQLFDSLRSWVTSMGTAKDPVRTAQHVLFLLGRGELEAAYRSDWVARKVVDIPAKDATREWRAWKATQEQIKKIEEVERALSIRAKTKQVLTKARLYGGGAMVLGVNKGTEGEELKVETVTTDDLKFVHVCAAHELVCGQIIGDPTSPWFGEPEYYTRAGGDSTTKIHPSRVVRFVGAELPDRTLVSPLGAGWGDSILQIVDDAVRGAGLVTGSIASMIHDSKLDVIKVPELTARLTHKDYQEKLTAKFTYANQTKSILNAIVVDKEEEWQRIQTSFNALPDLLKMYLLIASGAAHIPATVMLGQSAQGLNATGDNDVRNYYDRIKNEQTTEIQPTLSRLDEVIIRSALGSRDPEIHYDWNPLWQMTENEKADLAKKKADTAKVDADSGLVPIEALSEVRVNQLVEDGTYPGLEQAVEDAEAAAEEAEAELEEVDPLETDPRALPAPGPRAALPAPGAARSRRVAQPGDLVDSRMRRKVADMRPRTLYLSRDVVNGEAILAWARGQGFTDLADASELHVTIAYSRAAVNWMELGEPWNQDERGRVKVAPGGPRAVESLGDEGVVCLLFSNTNLQWRHGDVIRAGGSHDYPQYQPHVTFAISSAGAPNLDLVEPYRGEIILGPEVFQEIKREGHSYTEAAE